jgi:hypothetical protein
MQQYFPAKFRSDFDWSNPALLQAHFVVSDDLVNEPCVPKDRKVLQICRPAWFSHDMQLHHGIVIKAIHNIELREAKPRVLPWFQLFMKELQLYGQLSQHKFS